MPAVKKSKAAKRKTKIDKELEKPVVQKQRRVSHPSYESYCAGRVLTVGQGDMGQLGLGEDIVERKRPAIVTGLENETIVQVACGGMHTVALTEEGEVYTWGCNDEGALGRPTNSDDGDEFLTRKVEIASKPKVIQVSAGDSHTSALTSDGIVYAWGTYRDSSGVIGLTASGLSRHPLQLYPKEGVLEFDRAIKIASGNDHTAILTEGGNVLTLGTGEQGQLGRVKECFSQRGGRRGVQYLLSPDLVRFKGKRRFSDVFTGSYQTFAVSSDKGFVFGWGLNNYGQLCTGDTDNYYAPCRIESLSELHQKGDLKIAAGQHHSVISTSDGQLYTCGRAEYGRLGLGESAKETSEPVKVKSESIVEVSCGEAASFAVSKKGELYSWGLGNCLQLGNGEDEDVFEPTLVKSKNLDYSKHEVVNVASGGQHSVILVRDKS